MPLLNWIALPPNSNHCAYCLNTWADHFNELNKNSSNNGKSAYVDNVSSTSTFVLHPQSLIFKNYTVSRITKAVKKELITVWKHSKVLLGHVDELTPVDLFSRKFPIWSIYEKVNLFIYFLLIHKPFSLRNFMLIVKNRWNSRKFQTALVTATFIMIYR